MFHDSRKCSFLSLLSVKFVLFSVKFISDVSCVDNRDIIQLSYTAKQLVRLTIFGLVMIWRKVDKTGSTAPTDPAAVGRVEKLR